MGGYSAFAIVGQAAFTLEHARSGGTGYLLRCGHWMRWRGIMDSSPALQRNWRRWARLTPTVHEGKVYALGGTGVLRCLDAATGKEIWIRDVLTDVGTDYETDRAGVWWGRSASPLIVDDLASSRRGSAGGAKSFARRVQPRERRDCLERGQSPGQL